MSAHLETHPKDMIVKALCSFAILNGTSITTEATDAKHLEFITGNDQQETKSPGALDNTDSENFYYQSETTIIKEEEEEQLKYMPDEDEQNEFTSPEDLSQMDEKKDSIEIINPPAPATPLPSTPIKTEPAVVKTPAHILSVSVLKPKKQVITIGNNQVSAKCSNPIQLPPKKTKVITIPLPGPSSSQEVPPIRSVATSVIRIAPERPKIAQSLKNELITMLKNKQNSPDVVTKIVGDSDQSLTESTGTTPNAADQLPPSESTLSNPPPAVASSSKSHCSGWSKALSNNKPPKVLKITFKKPIKLEPTAVEEPTPSTSQQALAPANELPQEDPLNLISENLVGGEKQEQVELEQVFLQQQPVEESCLNQPIKTELAEEIIEQDAHEAMQMSAGMLQLKAEAYEEVFISQHSLIRLEEAQRMNYICGGGGDGPMIHHLDDSGSPVKFLMDIKRENHGPPSIEELSDSSVCSMITERINVNIRAEEMMPAKGEISEQESNADSELQWPSNTVEVIN